MATRSWKDLVKDAGDVTTFSALPDGPYNFKVLEAKVQKTSSDKTMFVVKAEVQDGPHAKRLVWDNITVTEDNPKAMGFFFGKMAALGLTPENFFSRLSEDADESDRQIAAALPGRYFRGLVGHREWKGVTKNDISRYLPAGAASAPMPTAAPAYAAPAPQAAPPMAPAPQAAPPMAAPAPVAAPVYAAPPAPVAPPVAAPAPVAVAPAPVAPAPAPVAPAPAVESPWDVSATGPAVLQPNLTPAPQPPVFG